MSEPETKKPKVEGSKELYEPKNILLTGGAGERASLKLKLILVDVLPH